jgi:hypothetical protein
MHTAARRIATSTSSSYRQRVCALHLLVATDGEFRTTTPKEVQRTLRRARAPAQDLPGPRRGAATGGTDSFAPFSGLVLRDARTLHRRPRQPPGHRGGHHGARPLATVKVRRRRWPSPGVAGSRAGSTPRSSSATLCAPPTASRRPSSAGWRMERKDRVDAPPRRWVNSR